MQEMVIGDKTYPIIGVGAHSLPIVDIPLMSDERWQELVQEQSKKASAETAISN